MRYVITRWIPAGSVALMITTFLSYALGLLRDRIFAQTYGLSADLDAYNAAFLLPDFFFNVLVASGIAAAVVPLFSDLRQKRSPHAYTYINSLLSAATLTTLVSAVFFFIFAEPASVLVAPGLSADSQHLTAQLIRIVALSPIFFAVSNGLGALLLAEKRFIYYGLSPVFYNLGIIGGTLWLAPRYGIMGTALGTLLGAACHALVRMLGAWYAGWRPDLAWQWRTAEFKKTLQLMVPKMIGHPVELATFWMFTVFASTLGAGSIAALNFARNFQSVPVSLVGITVSTATFPVLADAISRRDFSRFAHTLRHVAVSILALSSVAAVVLYVLRFPLVQILLGGGAFDANAVRTTANLLGMFCLAIPTEAFNHLLARSFYARKNTIIPVAFSVLSLVVAAGVSWWMLPQLQLHALALGFLFGSLVKTVGLLTLLVRADPAIDTAH